MEVKLRFPNNEKLFLRNPESSVLGNKIIHKSLDQIEELGIEHFNFKKLAQDIQSNEASVYRYFENKHQLLIYLISIYWEVMNLKIQYNTQNISDPVKKLKKLIYAITEVETADPIVENIDLRKLNEIMVSESAKAYLTKDIDMEIREGHFQAYEKLIGTICGIFQEANPTYEFPKALSINLLETTFEQAYFSKHLQSLTELNGKEKKSKTLKRFLESIIFSVLGIKSDVIPN